MGRKRLPWLLIRQVVIKNYAQNLGHAFDAPNSSQQY